MDKYLKIIFISLIVSSCSFLDEKPSTGVVATNVYATEAGLESAIYGIYGQFNSAASLNGKQIEFLQSASLCSHWGKKRSTDQWLSCLKMTLYRNSSDNSSYYEWLYKIVSCCNALIEGVENSPVEPSYKTQILAEAKFIRGVTYFYLVRMYGDVPLQLSPVRNFDESCIERTKYTDVYIQILEDLSFAEEHMRTTAEQKTMTGSNNRPGKYAATSFKAAVYMQIASILYDPDHQFFDNTKEERRPDFTSIGITDEVKAWEMVEKCCNKVIESGEYSLATDYASLFRWKEPEDFNLSERIFVLNSTSASNQYNSIAQLTLPQCPEGSINFEDNNKNSNRVTPDRYVHQIWTKTHGGILDSGRSDKFENVWVKCKDPRMDVSYFHTSYINQLDHKDVVTKLYPSDGCVGTNATKLYFKKYLDPLYNGGPSNADYYVMRYANIFLMRAESFASRSGAKGDDMWDKAINDIEIIHQRARGELNPSAVQSDYPNWASSSFDSPSSLIKGIIWERIFELGGEGNEYFDTHRRGSAFMSEFIASPLKSFLSEKEQTRSKADFFPQEIETDPELLKKSVVLEFPIDELQRNTKLQQNDFSWE